MKLAWATGIGNISVQEARPAVPNGSYRRSETRPVTTGFLGQNGPHPPGTFTGCQVRLPSAGCHLARLPWPYLALFPILWSFSGRLVWISATSFNLNISFQTKCKLIICTFWSDWFKTLIFKKHFFLESFAYSPSTISQKWLCQLY